MISFSVPRGMAGRAAGSSASPSNENTSSLWIIQELMFEIKGAAMDFLSLAFISWGMYL